MILDTLLCDLLLNNKMNKKFILLFMSIYYILLYISIYLFVIKKAFDSQIVLIPSIVISLIFFIWRLSSINRYAKSKIA